MKVIKTKEDLLLSISKAVNYATDIVASTYGPNGTNVVIENKFEKPRYTNDGYTVLKSIEVENEIENLAIRVLEDSARQTNEEAGDGTTTTTILTREIFNTLKDKITPENKGLIKHKIDLKELTKEINAHKDQIIKRLVEEYSTPIKNKKDLEKIASVASEDEGIAKIVAEIVDKVGAKGDVRIEEGDSWDVKYEIREGFTINNGYASKAMITNKQLESIHDDIGVFVYDHKIGLEDVAIKLDNLVKEGKNKIVIMATDFDVFFLERCSYEWVQGSFKALLVKIPIWMTGCAEDICSITGAKLNEEAGKIKRIVSTPIRTTIFGTESPNKTIEELNNMLPSLKALDKHQMEERIARLQGKVAIIKVGAKSDSMVTHLKDKIEDCIHATQGALEEGYVKGGGITLKKLSKDIVGPLSPALAVPSELLDMEVSAEVIDSTKSTRIAIESAVATALVLAKSGALIAIKNEDDTK